MYSITRELCPKLCPHLHQLPVMILQILATTFNAVAFMAPEDSIIPARASTSQRQLTPGSSLTTAIREVPFYPQTSEQVILVTPFTQANLAIFRNSLKQYRQRPITR